MRTVVRVGYTDICLGPKAKAEDLVKCLSGAVIVRGDYKGNKVIYVIDEPVEIEIRQVPDNRFSLKPVEPEVDETTPARRGLLLEE